MSVPLGGRRILVAGIGNIFLSDDGFGPEVARRFAPGRDASADVRVVDYGIRGMHLAYDLLEGYDALVIVDAIPPEQDSLDETPGILRVLSVGPDDLGEAELDAHGMNPVAVLASLGALGGTLPPTYIVGCCPASLEEAMGLTDEVNAVVDDAVALTARVVDDLLASRPVLGGGLECASESPVG
ncbi:MAG: hydrogenase maturation protease [Nocardioidaceae bacterium]